jgi:hypothetical protein
VERWQRKDAEVKDAFRVGRYRCRVILGGSGHVGFMHARFDFFFFFTFLFILFNFIFNFIFIIYLN